MYRKMKSIMTLWLLLLIVFSVVIGCIPNDIGGNGTESHVERMLPTLIRTNTKTPTVMQNMVTAVITPTPSATTIHTADPPENEITATPVDCAEIHGFVEERVMPSEQDQGEVVMRVYLPACYGSEPGELYPVLYLLHGQSFNEDQWERLGVREIADRRISEGLAKPFIIVMPREVLYLEDPNESDFKRILVDELIPWIENEYDVCREFDCRAIGGISRGAAWSVRIGLQECGLFGAIGAHSLPPFRGDITNLQYQLMNCPQDLRPRIYIDIGNYDRYLEAASQFQSALTAYRATHEWHLNEGTHDELYWRNHVNEYIEWYTIPWN